MQRIKSWLAVILITVTLACMTPVELSAWSGSTHSDLVGWAFEMLVNDLGTEISNDVNYQRLMQYMNVMKDAADDPDNFSDVLREVITENSIWASHFYNPYTGRTYTGSDSNAPNDTPQIHALYMATKYMDKAVTQWEMGAYEAGAYYLGYASHFITDACNPHHAALKTVFDDTKNHGDFESFVDQNRLDYRISNIDSDPAIRRQVYESTVSANRGFHDFLKSNMDFYGKRSYEMYSEARYETSAGGHWDNAARATMENTQKSLALVYYRFLKEVASADKLIKLQIKTSNVLYAGTDDDLFFGMQTSDGKRIEFGLDNMAYSNGEISQVQDFEMDTTTTVYYKFYNPDFDLSKVTSVWLRKDPIMPFSGDDWKADTVHIYVNDSLVHSNSLNQWLKPGYETHSWSTPGGLVRPAGTALGTINLTVKTSEDTFSGTDNDIYFGIILSNGMRQEFLLDSSDNDFEAGSRRTYSFTINDTHYQPNQISQFYFRKYANYIQGGIDDAWKVEAAAIKLWGQTAYAKVLNKWIEGGDEITYAWSAAGINTQSPIIGFIDATISTSSDWWSGTDDNVYFGVRYSDGTYSEFLCDSSANDFEMGSTRTYYFCIGKTRSSVTALYVKKQAGGDDWKVASVVTKIDGVTVNSKTINTWIKNSYTTYQWSAAGL
ncbi:MAG: PLAT/LH2 domain-containing protein [Bacillota bacterium]